MHLQTPEDSTSSSEYQEGARLLPQVGYFHGNHYDQVKRRSIIPGDFPGKVALGKGKDLHGLRPSPGHRSASLAELIRYRE